MGMQDILFSNIVRPDLPGEYAEAPVHGTFGTIDIQLEADFFLNPQIRITYTRTVDNEEKIDIYRMSGSIREVMRVADELDVFHVNDLFQAMSAAYLDAML